MARLRLRALSNSLSASLFVAKSTKNFNLFSLCCGFVVIFCKANLSPTNWCLCVAHHRCKMFAILTSNTWSRCFLWRCYLLYIFSLISCSNFCKNICLTFSLKFRFKMEIFLLFVGLWPNKCWKHLWSAVGLSGSIETGGNERKTIEN